MAAGHAEGQRGRDPGQGAGEPVPTARCYDCFIVRLFLAIIIDTSQIWLQGALKGSGGGARGKELVSLCQLPLVLDPEAKARIMQGEALLQKQHEVQASAINVSMLAVTDCSHCMGLCQTLQEAA